jgi:hypothetical protein
MTTVAQLIEFLQTLPQDAEVDVMAERTGPWTSYTEFEELQIPNEIGNSDNIEVFDFRDNHFVKEGDPRFGKVYVSFGGR